MASGLLRPAGHLDIANALRPYHGVWNERQSAHLLRRAGFGSSPKVIHDATAISMDHAVSILLGMPPADAAGRPDIFDARAAMIAARMQYGKRGSNDPVALKAAIQSLRRQEFRSLMGMQLWWLNRMLASPAPLQERMTMLFHGHFTTAALQKGVSPDMVFNQNQLFRSHALGNLRDLTLAVSQDPAMLIYLDNARSEKRHPNENYARELMELFTLGIGNYSEEDVRQSARAFTGWSVDYRTGQFVNRPNAHDPGTKTFLGQTGNFDGSDIIRIIYEQPACAKQWATTLLNNFVYNNPEPQLVDAVATELRRHNFELAPVMSTLLRSNVFHSERAYRALVKSPVEFVVGSYAALGLSQIDARAVGALRQMGQVLYYPPNVAGWPPGSNWVTSEMLISRENFLAGLVNSPMMRQSSWISQIPMRADGATKMLVEALLGGDASAASYAQLSQYLDGVGTAALGTLSPENYEMRVRGGAYLTMAMPAYQLA